MTDTLQSGAESAPAKSALIEDPWEDRYETGVQPWSFRLPANSPSREIADAMQAEINELRPLVALARRATAPQAPGVVTDAQISAGAEVLCDCPKPKRIGRSAAISVFDAMSAAKPVEAAGSAVPTDMRAAFERTEAGQDLSRAWGFGLDSSDYANPYVQHRWTGFQRGAATHPAEPVGKPSDCSGDPSCCPDNEGYGCHCSPAVPAVGSALVAKAEQQRELSEVISYAIAAHKKGIPAEKLFTALPTDANGWLAKFIMDAIEHHRPDVQNVATKDDSFGLCMMVAEAAHRAATGSKAMPSDKLRSIVEEALAAPTESAAAPADLSQAARDVLAERRRQVEQEGWTPEHDDQYRNCELARAAATYAVCSHIDQLMLCGERLWPWRHDWWKRTTYRRDLTKAGALILAEIERLDRATQPTGNAEQGEQS